MKTVLSALNQGLHNAFAADSEVYLIGEDLLDPYGGAFKVSKGLSSTYPDRVLTTPISEHAITNFAVGMALQGKKPIVEIMFGDFVSLIMDPLINTLPKLTHMYAQQKPLPILIRTPMGAGRGYGPTHSQSLEKFITAIEGIHTYAPTKFLDPTAFITSLIIEESAPHLLGRTQTAISPSSSHPRRARRIHPNPTSSQSILCPHHRAQTLWCPCASTHPHQLWLPCRHRQRTRQRTCL